MKLSGYIQFPVNFCMGKFLISGLELKTGNWSFPEEPTIIPCNIFLRFLFFRFELPTGNWNDDLALVQGQLYTTPKFHSNPSYSPWGEEGSTLKKTASESFCVSHNFEHVPISSCFLTFPMYPHQLPRPNWSGRWFNCCGAVEAKVRTAVRLKL